MTGKVKTILDDLVSRITAEGTCRFIREKLFSDDVDIPCRRWSPLNRFLVFLSGTIDARGIRQWNAVGRKVMKGASAIHILAPTFLRNAVGHGNQSDEENDPEETKTIPVLAGFRTIPVFRVEDTEGDPLPYEKRIEAFDVAQLPLIEVAWKLGVTVRGEITQGYSGAFRRSTLEIILGTDNPQTFLHELSHAVDLALPDWNNDYAFGEVVAELSSCFLAHLHGIHVSIESTKAYIEGYVGREHVALKIIAALGRVEAIYQFIEGEEGKERGHSIPDWMPLNERALPVPSQMQLIA